VITFCLVHGAWHDDACWEPVVGELARRGHQCVTPVPPLERADASFEDYAQVVIDSLEGRDAAVLVGHSMSSAVIPLVAIKRPAVTACLGCAWHAWKVDDDQDEPAAQTDRPHWAIGRSKSNTLVGRCLRTICQRVRWGHADAQAVERR